MRAAPLLLLAGCIPELPDLEDPCARWPDTGRFRTTIVPPDSRERDPYVYVPASEGPRDLLVLLHGGGMSGPRFAEATEFEALADREGFVVVYPNGLGWPIRSWNAGPQYDPDGDEADDVAFLDQLVDELAPKVCGGRVWAVGFSVGGMMAERWACESDRVAGVASAAGPLMVSGCAGEPIPSRYYHGTDDAVVPIDGGRTSFLGRTVDFPSIDETLAAWRERNRCDATDPVVTADGDTTCTAWRCAAPTEQCVIEGWVHAWPGGVNGDATDAGATGAVWSFFQASVEGG